MHTKIHGYLQLFNGQFWKNILNIEDLIENEQLFSEALCGEGYGRFKTEIMNHGMPDIKSNPEIAYNINDYFDPVGYFTLNDLITYNWDDYLNLKDIEKLYGKISRLSSKYGIKNIRAIVWFETY